MSEAFLRAEDQNETLESQNWLVTNDSHCISLQLNDLALPEKPYRLYRFLTEIEDILETIPNDIERIKAIIPRIRLLLTSSYWLQMEFLTPNPDSGWSVRFLYQEHNFLLTVQIVAWLPGNISPIHNHGTWGIVALINGEEKNRFWRRTPTPKYPNRIELVDECILYPGDIIGFLPGAIHNVEPIGDEPTITFNLYGETDYSQRFEFDAIHHTAKNF